MYWQLHSIINLNLIAANPHMMPCHKTTMKHTKSPKAIGILKDWSKSVNNFIKVMPTDYKRALEMMAENKLEKSL